MASETATERDLALIRFYRRNWNRFIAEVLGVSLDSDQQAIVESVQQNRRTAVRSGHARGKDFTSACIALTFLFLHFPSKVILTAPTGRQVTKIMMSEVKAVAGRANAKLAEVGLNLGGRILTDGITFADHPDWFLLGFKAADKEVEDWSGFHSEHILVIVTEASGIEAETWTGIEGIVTGDSRLLIVGNPNHTHGGFYQAFTDARFHCFRLNCMNAPNVLAGRKLIPGQVARDYVEDHVTAPGWCRKISERDANPEAFHDFRWEGQWYRPSDLFRIKVLGEFPLQSADSLIPLRWVELAHQRWLEAEVPLGVPARLGLDVAGMGADNTVLCPRRDWYVHPLETWPKQSHMAHVGALGDRLRAFGPNAVAYVDAIGEGAAVYSRASELGQSVVAVKFSEAAEVEAKPLNDITGQITFLNMRAFCHWAVRDALNPEHGAKLALPPESHELVQDLTEVKWERCSDGRIKIEPKDELKKRLGRSPDYGDALMNTYWPKGMGQAMQSGAFRKIGGFF